MLWLIKLSYDNNVENCNKLLNILNYYEKGINYIFLFKCFDIIYWSTILIITIWK